MHDRVSCIFVKQLILWEGPASNGVNLMIPHISQNVYFERFEFSIYRLHYAVGEDVLYLW